MSMIATGSLSHNNVISGRHRYPGVSLSSISPQWLAVGYPVDGYWAQPILGYDDLNGDGKIGTANCRTDGWPTAPPCEVTLGSFSYLGSPTPTRTLSLRPNATYRGRVTLAALFDYRGGQKLYNRTAMARCLARVCRADQDPSTPLREQARVTADHLGSHAGFIEDASFWKLRELSLSIAAPDRWASRLGASRVSLTLAARNLATWSPYSGADPEADMAPSESLAVYDSFGQPAVRYLLTRLDIGW